MCDFEFLNGKFVVHTSNSATFQTPNKHPFETTRYSFDFSQHLPAAKAIQRSIMCYYYVSYYYEVKIITALVSKAHNTKSNCQSCNNLCLGKGTLEYNFP